MSEHVSISNYRNALENSEPWTDWTDTNWHAPCVAEEKDPDPHKMNADPQPCYYQYLFDRGSENIISVNGSLFRLKETPNIFR